MMCPFLRKLTLAAGVTTWIEKEEMSLDCLLLITIGINYFGSCVEISDDLAPMEVICP